MRITAKRSWPPAQRCRLAATLGNGEAELTQPHRVEAVLEFDSQGSRGGNPGLQGETALRFSITGDGGVEKIRSGSDPVLTFRDDRQECLSYSIAL